MQLRIALHRGRGIRKHINDCQVLKNALIGLRVGLDSLDEYPLLRIVGTDFLPYHTKAPSGRGIGPLHALRQLFQNNPHS